MGSSQHFCVGQMKRFALRGLVEMKNGLAVGLALALALLAGPRAYAFQEQTTGATAPPAQVEQPAPEGQPPADGKPLDLSGETAVKPDTGTEIRIPGLGKLGVLPKMDFGLELLYGAAEAKPAGQPEGTPDPDEDLTIRGTVKHRF
jgi:hypothetical protein